MKEIVKRCYIFELLCKEYATGNRTKLAQLFQNYDYVDCPSGPGTSVYKDMTDGKTESIPEWRKKNKKRQKENEKKITDTRPDKFKPKKG
jgi:hypothetical protein